MLTRFGRRPKRAIPLRTAEPFSKIKITFEGGEGLELLGDGQQVVVAGIHPDTQQPYTWLGGEPGKIARKSLPLITEAEGRELVEQCALLLVTDTAIAGPGKRSLPTDTAGGLRHRRTGGGWWARAQSKGSATPKFAG